MHLECPHCQAALRVPDRLRRYYDMPVRCYRCRHVFTVARQGPRDNSGPTHDARQSLDRSVSAQQSHHMTRCHGCGAALRVPGRQEPGRQEPGRQEPGRQEPGAQHPSGPLSVTCPHCLALFQHHGPDTTAHLDRLMIGLVAGIAMGCLVLWGHNEGYVELRHLDNASWISGLRQMLADLVYQLRTAAMARLV